MLGAVFFIIAVFNTPVDSGIREYDPEVAIEIYTPETPFDWVTPIYVHAQLKLYTLGAKYVGLLIAGQAEFPWVVDVRMEDLDQERWAIGNLVSSDWVVTVCHVLEEWQNAEKCGPTPDRNMAVLFCTNYLNEDYRRYDIHNRIIYKLAAGGDASGRRVIAGLHKHPKCDCKSRSYDALLIRLDIPINPYPPLVGYMPIVGGLFDARAGSWQIPPVTSRLQLMDQEKMVCYVASFGRKHVNLRLPYDLDYKVRYRVYYADWTFCLTNDMRQHMCITNEENIDESCMEQLNRFQEQLMCFRTHSTHGAVCEHDRGAPVVCNGEVHGMVVRGVHYLRCNNRRPMPFIIAKIDMLNGTYLSGRGGQVWKIEDVFHYVLQGENP